MGARPSGRATSPAGAVISDLGYSYTAPGTTGTTGDRTLVQTRTDTVGVGAPQGPRPPTGTTPCPG